MNRRDARKLAVRLEAVDARILASNEGYAATQTALAASQAAFAAARVARSKPKSIKEFLANRAKARGLVASVGATRTATCDCDPSFCP